MNRRAHLFFICLASLFSTSALATVKGSDSAVSVQVAYTFPQADSDNEILGFGWFKNGFTLEDSTTTCSFSSVFPVSGNIDLNGGTLRLTQDLMFINPTTLQGFGAIIGNEHQLDFCASITWLPADATELRDVTIQLNGDLLLSSTITCEGTCTFVGHHYSLDFSGGALCIGSGATLNLKNLKLENISGNKIYCHDDSGTLILDSIKWIQDGSYSFTQGSILFFDNVECRGKTGTYNFLYDSGQTSTILACSTLKVGDGINFVLGRKESGGTEPLAFTDNSSVLSLDGCSLTITSSGAQWVKGMITFDRDVPVDIQSTSTDNGLKLGNGVTDDDLALHFNPGSQLRLTSGHFTYNNASATKVTSSSKSARLVRQPNSYMYLAHSLTVPSLTLQYTSDDVAEIAIAEGKILEYDDARIVLPGSEFDIKSNRYDQYTFYLNGNDSLFLAKGQFPLNIQVSSSGNEIHGNGNIDGTITLKNSNATLTCDLYGEVDNAITMNGGTLTLGGDLVLGSDVVLTGSGTVNLASHRMLLGSTDVSWTSTILWEADGGTMKLGSNITFLSTWTISGNCIIEGDDNELIFNGGKIVVDEGSTLKLKNIRLNGLSDGSLLCADNAGSIILDDVTWIQGGDMTFDTGKILFKNEVDFSGSYTFVYDSSETSTIDVKSTLKITDDMRFSVGKKTVDGKEPLLLSDATSKLYLDNCNFNVTSNGMSLIRGKVIVDHNLDLDIASTSTINGLILGNGVAQDDVIVEIYPGGAARLKTGHLTYDITRPDAIKTSSNSARFMRYDNTFYHVKHDIVLTDLLIYATDLSYISLEDGVNLAYDNCLFALDSVEFTTKGYRYNGYTVGLNGDDHIYMAKGQLPMYLLVMGTGNKVWGSGIIKGGITLYDSAAELTWDINGALGNFLNLNGGTLILDSDLICMNSASLLGNGTISLGGNRMKFGSSDIAIASSIYWDGDDGIIDINSNVSLSGTWTFSGYCTVCSDKHIIDLANGDLVVEQGSSLMLRNVTLHNVAGTNIRCLDDNASIVLDNVSWEQSDSFTFTTGALQFKKNVGLKGTFETIFAYQSSETSTVLGDTELVLEGGITFSYDPGIASKDLLAFIDNSSQLTIEDGSTLHTTGTGVTLSKGTLRIKEEGYLSSEVIGELDEGVTLGNGTAADDMILMVCPSVKFKLLQGTLNYNNVATSSCYVGNVMSVLWIESGTTLGLYQTLNFMPGTVHFESNTSIARVTGKQLIGETDVAGSLNFISL